MGTHMAVANSTAAQEMRNSLGGMIALRFTGERDAGLTVRDQEHCFSYPFIARVGHRPQAACRPHEIVVRAQGMHRPERDQNACLFLQR